MKLQKVLRTLILTSIALYFTTIMVPGFSITGNASGFFLAAVTITLLNIFLRPLIKLLLLPINVITLGTLRWLANIIILYFLSAILTSVSIQPFVLSQIPTLGLMLPDWQLNVFFTTLVVSLFLNISHGLLSWLIK